jgi:predicted regulator of Ras-like GTPase activity (Roadblock/LC7/MglB family)
MDYQVILDDLQRRMAGSRGVLLLDVAGEVVLESGNRDERLRLIGAYQGIALAGARKASERYSTGEIEYMLWRYEHGSVILRPLKDGYFLVMNLASDVLPAQALLLSAEAQERLNEAL